MYKPLREGFGEWREILNFNIVHRDLYQSEKGQEYMQYDTVCLRSVRCGDGFLDYDFKENREELLDDWRKLSFQVGSCVAQ